MEDVVCTLTCVSFCYRIGFVSNARYVGKGLCCILIKLIWIYSSDLVGHVIEI